MLKRISSTLIFILLLVPISTVRVQADSCIPVTNANFNTCCTNAATTAEVNACQAYYNNGGGSSAPNTPSPSNTVPSIGTTTGLQYQPQVSLQYGANNSFGGLSFKGVGAALVSCTGVGNLISKYVGLGTAALSGLVNKGLSAAASATSGIPVISSITSFFSSTVASSTPVPTSNTTLDNKAACLDGIAYVLSQQVLQQITNRTLHWANTGFNGNPLYVKNIDSYLLSIRNQQLNNFLQSSQNSNPIFGNAIRSVITQQVTGRSDGLLNTPLNTVQSQNYNSFVGDFTSGGWDSFLNPAYNPIGALFNATDNIGQSITTAQQNTQNELQRNNGFLDMKTCVQYANNGQVANSTVNGAGLSTAPTCLKYETVTPGSIVAQQVSTITNSPTRQAELATQFNQAVGSFFDSLLNQLFSRGLSGIKGQANPADLGLSYGGLGSNVVTGTDGQPIAGVNDNVQSIDAIAAASSGGIDISKPQLLRAVIQTQYNYLNRSSDSRMIFDRLVPDLGQLDYCVPGPNPTWQDSLNANVTAYTTAATVTSNGTDSAISNTGLSLYDKFSTTTQPIGNRNLSVLANPDAKGYMQAVNNSLQQEITTKFSRDAIIAAYGATAAGAANQNYAQGMAANAYDEVTNLPAFVQNAVTVDQQYAQKIATTQGDIQELESINTQVLKIVSAAKARYVSQQKAAGTPVNQVCLDAAYGTDTTAVTGVGRQESNTPSPVIQEGLDAQKYFYNSL
ncbi:MAG: hypothetical protein JWM92_286 [Candidatus Nomurabacteria bacterium]|nr:hypothetical protein [Candidatus Nomurabacteria bacterium]